MMERRLILNAQLLELTLQRLCMQLVENHNNFENTVLLGLQPRGIYLADRLAKLLEPISGHKIALGYLDVTFYRDDFRRRDTPLRANATNIPFIIEGREVILIDDVFYTGRTVRAALDAMIAFGRPSKVELLTLINRRYCRDLPVAPDYVGKSVNTLESERVLVEWKEQGATSDNIWLTTKQ